MSPITYVVGCAAGVALVATVAWLFTARRRLVADVDRFAGFMDHGPFVAFMKDAEGRYIYENRALVELMAKIRPGMKTMIGRTDRELFPFPEGAAYVDHDRLVIEHGKPLQFDETSVDADRTVRHWSSIKFPRVDRRGRPCVAGISIEITDLRRARTDARSSEDRCALALEAGRMGDFRMDLATQTLDTSPLFATLHGRPESKTRLTLAESLAEVHPDDHKTVVAAVEAALQGRAPTRVSYRVVLPDGGVRWVELVGRVFVNEAGQPTIVHGVGFDITDQRAAYEELARRKTILRRLIDVQENERQTLCHELHDGLIQYAIGAKMQLDTARDETDAMARAQCIEAAIDCLERGIAEGRQVIRGVRPAVLDDLGLTAAIEDLVEQMAAAGIVVETALDERLDAVPPHLRTTIYRVVQEALTNARKHAGVDRATVEVRCAVDEVHVQVNDEGSGFVVDEGRKRGFGLVGMSERVRLAGGMFRIESRPGNGTQVSVRLPLLTAAAAEAPMAYAAAPGFGAR